MYKIYIPTYPHTYTTHVASWIGCARCVLCIGPGRAFYH